MDYYLTIKWLHILSSTILFGTGLGTAFFMWMAHLTSKPTIISEITKVVVKADWIFTATSGVVQPITGILLAREMGIDLTSKWLIWVYVLYTIAFACWVPVVWLQIRMRNLAAIAASTNSELPLQYFKYARTWFILGWPAFIALLAIFYLMIAKPV